MNIRHIGIPVRDMEKELAYYLKMGLKIKSDIKETVRIVKLEDKNGMVLELLQYESQGPGKEPHVAFTFDPEDNMMEIVQQNRPKIVCLCGSTRFVDTFNEWRKKLTLEGCIVVSIELVIPQSEREDPQHSNYKVKQMLDELHLRKIDLADEVMILNVGGYIGESTRNEIEYARKLGKPIEYLEKE